MQNSYLSKASDQLRHCDYFRKQRKITHNDVRR